MIHKFERNGKYIVLDVNSGVLHVVAASVFRVLDFFHNGHGDLDKALANLGGEFYEDEIRLAHKEINELINEKLLFSADIYKEADAAPSGIVKALCLLVAQSCNLQCRYCFAVDYTSCGDSDTALMSTDVGKAAIDFLLANSGNRRNLEVDFFGGEPLLNWDTVVEIVRYGRDREKEFGKNIRFTLTTNGVLLDSEKMDFINRHISNIVLSLDGRREVNDPMRGGGTYDVLVPAFKQIAESRNQDNYYIRGTFTAKNLDFTNDVKHIADLGFRQISVEPIIGGGADLELRVEHLVEIKEEYWRLADIMIKNPEAFNFFHFNIDLNGGPCAKKRINGCGAGTEYLAIAANGAMYPCHQFADKPEFILGSLAVDNTDYKNTKINDRFAQTNIYGIEKCRTCWGRFFCGGGCAANAYVTNGDLCSPYEIGCEMQLARTECALYIKAARSS